MPQAKVTHEFLQSVQTAIGRTILPQSVRPNGLRLDPVQLRASIGTAGWAADAVLASLTAGTLAEVSYPSTAPSGYYRSKGGTGNVYAGFITGFSVDVQPFEVDPAGVSLQAMFDALQGVNLRVFSFGQYTEIPLRECLRLFPNVATGDASTFTSGACPGSGKPTYELQGGLIWDGESASNLELVANRAYAPAVPSAFRVDMRIWGALASLDSNERQLLVNGSLPGPLPCGADGVRTIAAVSSALTAPMRPEVAAAARELRNGMPQ